MTNGEKRNLETLHQNVLSFLNNNTVFMSPAQIAAVKAHAKDQLSRLSSRDFESHSSAVGYYKEAMKEHFMTRKGAPMRYPDWLY